MADHKTVKVYVLYRGTGQDRQAIYSDEELDVVKAHRLDDIRDYHRAGYARPEHSITCRTIEIPLDKDGKDIVHKSTCEETEVDFRSVA